VKTTNPKCTANCDSDGPDHWSYCAVSWSHLQGADDIAKMRQILMLWNQGDEKTKRMAYGITARAAQLGLEPPPDSPLPIYEDDAA
jgi:hypothetical protein